MMAEGSKRNYRERVRDTQTFLLLKVYTGFLP